MEKPVEIDNARHALAVLQRFDSLRRKNKYCDFKIKCGQEELPVHKCVVAANTEYFNDMFGDDNTDNNEGAVEINQAHPGSIRKCVEFMYSGKATVPNGCEGELFHAAHMLDLPRLCDGIAIFLEKNMDCESFFQTRTIAKQCKHRKLMTVCDEFALTNFEALAEKDDFKSLEVEYVKFLLSWKNLEGNDGTKCKALINWINNNQNHSCSLFSLMEGINFQNVPLSYRMYILNNEECVFTNVECMRHILNSVSCTQGTAPQDFSFGGELGIILFDTTSKKLQRFSINDKSWTEMQVKTKTTLTFLEAIVPKASKFDCYLLMYVSPARSIPTFILQSPHANHKSEKMLLKIAAKSKTDHYPPIVPTLSRMPTNGLSIAPG